MSAEQEEWAAVYLLALASRLEAVRAFSLLETVIDVHLGKGASAELRNDVGTLCMISRLLVP